MFKVNNEVTRTKFVGVVSMPCFVDFEKLHSVTAPVYIELDSFDLRGESHINFRTRCVIMTLAGRCTITNDVLKFGKVIEFESSCIAICFSYIYRISDGKTFIN